MGQRNSGVFFMAKVLDKIKSPADLKKLSSQELEALAKEIRELLVSATAKTGGHLAPNLGVVELTIGLHLALDSPKDKIIFDVGHQSYVHKLLTSRKDKFYSLRQYGGISGFPKREESPHDIFNTGHASTSVSVALGLAEARDKRKTDETIVAVIGDGSLTGGMSYEALNQAGHLKSRLIVILNDNEMSITNNVGAMASYLSKIRLDPAYNKFKEDLEERIEKIPGVGKLMRTVGVNIRDSIKHLVVPGMIFEELGFRYVGPIDGHNIEVIKESVSLARKTNKPVLIHAVTKKGKGYLPAETRPEDFHGTSPFVIKTGEPKENGKYPTYTEVFGQTLVELAKENEKIIAITAAMPSGTGLDKFANQFPNRFYDVGIAEQHAVTFAAGLACGGFLPVVAIYSTFLERAYDQLIQDIALQNLHIIFAIDRGGLVGEDGPTHHGAFDLSYLRHIPQMIVAAPKDEEELRHMLYTATLVDSPFAIRYPRAEGKGVKRKKKLSRLKIGQAEILEKGKDIVLIAIGRMVEVAQDTSALLKKKGYLPTVINARFAKPLDEELIVKEAQKAELLVTLEENSLVGGFGSGVLELLARENCQVEVVNFGLPDRFVTHGKVGRLFKDLELDATSITKEIERKLADSKREKKIGKLRLISS